MGTPYIGEIKMFAGNFAPEGWAFCMGQLLPISENDALFALIGTTYGGDGQNTFALPNLCGRVPVHMGQGPGISQYYQMGEMLGVEQVALTANQLASHQHSLAVTTAQASSNDPAGRMLAAAGAEVYGPLGNTVDMSSQGVGTGGGSQPHENMQPYLCINYIISLYGIFPSQT